MTASLRELARRTYLFSCSHEAADGIYGHNYRLEVRYELRDDAAAREAEARIQKHLIDRIHSRDLCADRALFDGRTVLDDRLIARVLAGRAAELAAPIKLESAVLYRNDKDAIEIAF